MSVETASYFSNNYTVSQTWPTMSLFVTLTHGQTIFVSFVADIGCEKYVINLT